MSRVRVVPVRRSPIALLTVVVAVLIWSAINPLKPMTWFFETIWVVVGIVVVLIFWRRFPLTTLLCGLLALHAVVLAYGGHYGYANTPAGDAVQDWFDLARNPFDRLGHFLQGFAPAIAVREVLWRCSPLRGSRWLPWLTLSVCLAISAFWELMEWWGALLVEGGNPSFLGGQGDPWDTQWDMLLALFGAGLALVTLSRVHDRQLERLTLAGTTQRADAAPRRA
jgi:putative membrane protein